MELGASLPPAPTECQHSLRTILPLWVRVQGWGENDRGVSYTFGPDSVTEFLQKHDLDLICRAHQVSWAAALQLCCCCCCWCG